MKKDRAEATTTSVVMPVELKVWLQEKAARSCRSFSGEVVSRLLESKQKEEKQDEAA